MLTATMVQLDAAVPVLDPDPSKDPDTTNHQRSSPVSLFEAAAAQIADDQLRSYLPPTAELELAHRHQRNLSPLPVLEDPANLPGTATLATDAHKGRRYASESPRGGLPIFPPGRSHHTSFDNNWR